MKFATGRFYGEGGKKAKVLKAEAGRLLLLVLRAGIYADHAPCS